MTDRNEQPPLLTPEDICAHAGDRYADFMGAIVPPIFQNSLFVKPTSHNGVDNHGYVYTRGENPTTAIAEEKIAALEGGEACLCFSSGMGAIAAAIMYSVKKDCHVVLVQTSYGPTRSLLGGFLAEKFGVEVTMIGGNRTDEILSAVRDNTALIYLESPSSILFHIQDLDVISAFAKERGITTVIDNTYATPLHQRPISHGIDIVCHTASKYMGGHSDIVAGALIGSREVVETIRQRERALLGACMDPHQAWLLIRGLRTLPVRLKQHGENGLKVAAFLEKHPKVKRVFYPGSDTYEQKELFQKYLHGETNGLMSFVPYGTPEEITEMVARLRFFQNGVSWGGFESLVVPITVGQSEEESAKTGLPANLVRIHVGLESVETLIADMDQALAYITTE